MFLFTCILTLGVISVCQREYRSGARFSKAPETFLARKAMFR